MNERIRELAIQAGDDWNQTLPSDREFLHKFAELVRADEREACAYLCSATAAGRDAEAIEEAIRARGGEK
jgi:hypothetical protein